MDGNNKFWIENIGCLFKSNYIVPLTSMSLENQLNTLTRLVLTIVIILLFFNFNYSLYFLIFSLLFIIIIYYIQKKEMKRTAKENFEVIYTKPDYNLNKITYNNVHPKKIPFCDDETSIDNYNTSLNQRLVGTANPLTFIKPVILPPSHDLEYWRDNNLVTHSAINNASSKQDMYLSGYAVSTCCGFLSSDTELVPEDNCTPSGSNPIIEKYGKSFDNNFNDITGINTSNGYNPEQINTSNIPSNMPVGNCEQNPGLKNYNKNLFTQIVTPGVYSTNEINEPINSNIGISFQQQFEPLKAVRDENGLHYTRQDPVSANNNSTDSSYDNDIPNYDNVYDPRFYGYGTSYRSYIEPVTGQTRFMYDDINAIRMPNYISRSKIDHLHYADKYGPMQSGSENGNIHNPNIRALVQDSWFRDSLDFRNDMTEKLMRKKNAEAWQRRQAPLGPHRR